MKKIFSILLLVAAFCPVFAQKVNETVALYGKEQLNGFTINIYNAPIDVVEGALVDKFENQFGMKGKKNKNYHVYQNYACPTFGEAKYDIYFTTQEVGKKKNRSVQVTLIVSTGNQNCITYANDPRTARNITTFLENFNNDVEAYAIKLKIDELNGQLAALDKERKSLEKEQSKIMDKLNKTNDEIKETANQVEAKTAEMTRLQEKYTSSHDPEVKSQIDKTAKDTQSLQKSQSNMQKSLLKLNNDLQKLNKKLDATVKNQEKTNAELREVERKR